MAPEIVASDSDAGSRITSHLAHISPRIVEWLAVHQQIHVAMYDQG